MLLIGERLKYLRLRKNVTQREIAESIQVSPVSLQRFEYGTVRPSLDKLIALADYFDVSLDYLVGRSDDDTPRTFNFGWQSIFRERLSDLLPTLNVADMDAANIDVSYLENVTYNDAPLNFHRAYCIADELGASLDYLLGFTDSPNRN